MTLQTIVPAQQIDIPRLAPPAARAGAGARTPRASFAQTLKDRAQRPSAADEHSEKPEPAIEAQVAETDSADDAQNQPVSTDGAAADESVAGTDNPDSDVAEKESTDQPTAPQVVASAVVEGVAPSSVSVATPKTQNASDPQIQDQHTSVSTPASNPTDAPNALQAVKAESAGATNSAGDDSSSAPVAQPAVINASAAGVTETRAGDGAISDSSNPTDISVDPAKTQSSALSDSPDKSKVDQAPGTASSSGEGVQSHAAGGVSAAEGAQSNPDSSFQQGQHRQAESLMRSAERTTLSQAEPEAPSANQRLFSATVSRGLEAAMRQKGGAVTIRLKPEALGSLRIQLHIEQGSISAQFQATTQRARDLLNEHMSSLRTSLEAKGFGVKSVEVQVQASSPGEHSSGEFGRSSEDAAGQTPTQDSGAHGQAHSRREDPDGFPYLNQNVDPFTEVEPIDTGWQRVGAGGVNTIA